MMSGIAKEIDRKVSFAFHGWYIPNSTKKFMVEYITSNNHRVGLKPKVHR